MLLGVRDKKGGVVTCGARCDGKDDWISWMCDVWDAALAGCIFLRWPHQYECIKNSFKSVRQIHISY